jgi:recombination protein RecA
VPAKALPLKNQIESVLARRVIPIAQPGVKPFLERVSSGIPEIDGVCEGGFPRGAVTEVSGSASSGRSGVVAAALAASASRGEVCGLVDTHGSFDPVAAAADGLQLERLLWVRCDARLERAFKAADLLLEAGGFGLVTLDLASSPPGEIERIPSAYWYRFRRAVETTPTAFLVVGSAACVRSAAALTLRLHKDGVRWSRRRLEAVCFRCERTKPAGPAPSRCTFEFPRASV